MNVNGRDIDLHCCTTADFLMVLAEHMKTASPEEVRGFREAWIAGAERQGEKTRKLQFERMCRQDAERVRALAKVRMFDIQHGSDRNN